MEYLLQPSKTYHRFHHQIAVNRYAVRRRLPPRKFRPNELRVLVIGDSIVYGGVRIDQTEIATEILKRHLQQNLGRPVVVGNASAKSWGPPNEFSYLKRYGTLDADVIILELSSHDYADAPTFRPVVGIRFRVSGSEASVGVSGFARHIFSLATFIGVQHRQTSTKRYSTQISIKAGYRGMSKRGT